MKEEQEKNFDNISSDEIPKEMTHRVQAINENLFEP